MREIKFDLPENLTREIYLKIVRKVYAVIRHSLWKKMQAKGVANLSKEEFESIEETIRQEE